MTNEPTDPLASKVFDAMTVTVIGLLVIIACLSVISIMTAQENGRLQGELGRVEEQLRNMRAK